MIKTIRRVLATPFFFVSVIGFVLALCFLAMGAATLSKEAIREVAILIRRWSDVLQDLSDE